MSPGSGTWYNSGTIVSVAATASGTYGFANFSGDLTGTTNPQNLTMSAPHTLTAYFGGATTQTWSTPGTYTWTVPTGVYAVAAQIWGGGGGGVYSAGRYQRNAGHHLHDCGGWRWRGGTQRCDAECGRPGRPQFRTGIFSRRRYRGWSRSLLFIRLRRAAPEDQAESMGLPEGRAVRASRSITASTPTGLATACSTLGISAAYGGTGGNSSNGGAGGAGGSSVYPANGVNGGAPGGGAGGAGASLDVNFNGLFFSGVGGTGAAGQVSVSYEATTAPLLTQTITSSPAGLTVTTGGTIVGGTIIGGTTCVTPCTAQWNAGTPHNIAVASPQSGGAGTQYIFAGWSDNGLAAHTVFPSTATNYTASFTTQYQLTTATIPASGGGTITPASGNWYNAGTGVTLAETPAAGFSFVNYTIPGGTLAGNTVTMSGPATVTANFATTQTITFNNPGSTTLITATVHLTGTATSGLTVTYSSGTTLVCTVAGSTVTLVALGTCAITANQAGNSIYYPATPVTQSFAVTPAAQTITFNNPGSVALPLGNVTLAATASSGLAISFASSTIASCTVTGNTLTPVALGTCSITANQAGNSIYSSATPVTQTFGVTLIPQSISFFLPGNPPGTVTLDKQITLSATATSGLPVSFSASGAACSVANGTAALTLIQVGTCTISANQAGGGNYQAATQLQYQLTVAPPLQVYTQVTCTNFNPAALTAASRTAGTTTITATVTGGSIPSARAYNWAGTGFQSSAQYSLTAPTANTSVLVTVSDGASTVTNNITVKASPGISDTTVQNMVLGKAIALADFSARLRYTAPAYAPFVIARLQSITGFNSAQVSTLLQHGTVFNLHAMTRSQLSSDLGPIANAAANQSWASLAAYFSSGDCGDEDCSGCDPDACDYCPPDCGSGGAPPDLLPGLTVNGLAAPPEIDPVTGLAQGDVYSWIENPDGLNILGPAQLPLQQAFHRSGPGRRHRSQHHPNQITLWRRLSRPHRRLRQPRSRLRVPMNSFTLRCMTPRVGMISAALKPGRSAVCLIRGRRI